MTALTRTWSYLPSTGSAPSITPPAAALSIGCTSTAIPCSGSAVPAPPSGAARSAESSTCRTARVNASQPRTSSTESNRPAIEEPSVSSCAEEERTTSAAGS